MVGGDNGLRSEAMDRFGPIYGGLTDQAHNPVFDFVPERYEAWPIPLIRVRRRPGEIGTLGSEHKRLERPL